MIRFAFPTADHAAVFCRDLDRNGLDRFTRRRHVVKVWHDQTLRLVALAREHGGTAT